MLIKQLINVMSSSLSFVSHRYVPWNVHEAEEGKFNFEGENDLVEFIKMADSVGLLVILRPGPYICGEWDFVSISNFYIILLACGQQI